MPVEEMLESGVSIMRSRTLGHYAKSLGIAATLASWDGAECSTTPDAGRDVIFTNQWPLLHVLALSGATGRGRSLIGVKSDIAQRVPSTTEPAAESRRGEHRGFDASRAT